MQIDTIAEQLIAARQGPAVPWRSVLPTDPAMAYAIQDATVARLGPVGGWKVGARSADATPSCAPLPASGLRAAGWASQAGERWRLRGVEVEVALRIARDFDPGDRVATREELAALFDAVIPAIEVVESRFADFEGSDPLAQLADLQSHGALVLGEPVAMSLDAVDLRSLEAFLAFDGRQVARTRGGHPTGDFWRLLSWLGRHCAMRGMPWRAGQIITTGSCTGMLFAPEGAHVEARLAGIGTVGLRF